MNAGSEPERDDTGLPPVDIEIPDDARELDRDVQAYYRELRARKRQQRSFRMRGSLARDGVVLPLLACCLILALITGTLLTVFTATSDRNLGLPGAGQATAHPPAAAKARSGSASTGSSSAVAGSGTRSASTGPPPGASVNLPALHVVPADQLPVTTITPVGEHPIAVQALKQAALVLIPAGCDCRAAVASLIFVSSRANARTYLVYTTGTAATVRQLYGQLTAGQRAAARLAFEPDTRLADKAHLSLATTTALTAIMLGPTKIVYAAVPGPNYNPTQLIQALTH